MAVIQLQKIRDLGKVFLHALKARERMGITAQVEPASLLFGNAIGTKMDLHVLIADRQPTEIQLDAHAAIGGLTKQADI